jgi:quercetin dioxygenase-like cupin family protein
VRIRNSAAFAATLDLITNRKGNMTVRTANVPGRLDVIGPIVEFLTPEGDEQVRAVIPPGVTAPLHSHDDFEDFYVLAGGAPSPRPRRRRPAMA